MKYILLLTLGFFSLSASQAFITTGELKKNFNEKNLILIDIAEYSIYEKSHIKGAIHSDISKFIEKESKKNKLISNKLIQEEIEDLGINTNSKVVIYSHNKAEGILNASYLAFILVYSGFENVSILDGGYLSWVFENELFISSLPEDDIQEGNFTISIQEHLISDAISIQNNLNSLAIIDARSPELYYGIKRSKNTTRAGHIKYAKSAFYNYNFLTDTTLREKNELDMIYIDGHKLKKDDEIVVYSDSIFSASMQWYILYKEMGFKNTKIYYNSIGEWAKDTNLSMRRFKWE
ncbi:MAG: thiosulfate sulfurtransferase [Sulfurimonas sp.]|nr:thiosulfate sulfurtransferase [Sulfurimonas sp.]